MPTTTITTDGVDTVDVGVISGDVDITTSVTDGRVTASATYSGADESYVVVGSGLVTTLDEEATHERVVAILSTGPGRDADGNVGSVSLSGATI